MLTPLHFFFCAYPDNFKKQEIRKAKKNTGIPNTRNPCEQ